MSTIDVPDWLEAIPAGSFQMLSNLGGTTTPLGVYDSPKVSTAGIDVVLVTLSFVNAVPVTITGNWVSFTGAGSFTVASFSFKKNSTATTTFAVIPQGPALTFHISVDGGTQQTFSLTITALPSSTVALALLPKPLVEQLSVSVAANSTSTFIFSAMSPGRSHLWGFTGSANNLIFVQRWNGTSWVFVAQTDTSTGNDVNNDIVLPLDDCRLGLQNQTAGALNMWGVVTGPG